jgi:DNA-binding PadR family transcriptional regulator
MVGTDAAWMRGSSPLKGALLGLLVQAPGHGYDLTNRLERRLGPAAQIESRTLYRQLEALEKAGLASSDRRVEPDRNRVVYTATPAAEAALAEWIGADAPLDPLRATLQAKIVVAGREHVPLLLKALDRYEERCFAMIGAYDEDPPPLETLLGIGILLAREATLAHIQAELSWADTARTALQAFAASHER